MKDLIRKALVTEITSEKMVLKKGAKTSESLKYHINEGLTLSENVYRIYSDEFFNLINEVRNLYELGLIHLNEEDKWIVNTDIGKTSLYEGNIVWLDVPFEIQDDEMVNEAEYQGRKVQLGKRMQGDVKKFKVYVKNDKGKVVKVNFGFGGKSAHGKRMVIKKNNPERRKNFRARMNCDTPGPRWKPRYWACKSW
jgi:hypothetical protein